MYVTCDINNIDSQIQAFFEPCLDQRFKYEVAVVELFYKNTWNENKGNFTIFWNEKAIKTFYFKSDFMDMRSLVDSINKTIQKLIKKEELSEDLIKYNIEYNEYDQKLILESNVLKFKFSKEAIDMFSLEKEYFQYVEINSKTFFSTNELLNLNCDIITDQVFGFNKYPIIRTFKVDPNQEQTFVYQCFDQPHYVDVSKTDFNYINLWLTDLNHKQKSLKEDFFVKLHFRIKQ